MIRATCEIYFKILSLEAWRDTFRIAERQIKPLLVTLL